MTSWSGTLPNPGAGDSLTDTAVIGAVFGLLAAISDPWTAYTPTWNGTSDPAIGNGTIEGAYRRTGSWGEAVFRILAGSTTTYGSGSYEFGLPSGWNIPLGVWGNNQGVGAVFDSSAGTYYLGNLGAVAANANHFRMRPTGQGNLTATSLVTLANGDMIMAHIWTELS